MIRILVTGSNGQLGWTIQQMAKDYPDISFVFKDSTELDITDKTQVEGIFNTYSFDYCINCAAYTNVEEAETHPNRAFAINAEGARKLAKSCKKKGTILINISTDYVFDGEKGAPYTVNDAPNPINEYGKSKLKGEQYIQEIVGNYFIVRTSWLYCKAYGKNFYRTILEKAKTEKVLYVTDQQTGCPTNTFNLAGYLLETIIKNKKEYGIYHYTDGKVMTWYGFAKRILKENDLERKISLEKAKDFRTFAPRPDNSVLAC